MIGPEISQVIESLTFRPLTRQEMDEAARIHRAAALDSDWFDPDLHTAAEDRAYFRNTVFAENRMLGAFEQGRMLGHLAWRRGWVNEFCVAPDWHGRGIGGALLGQVKAHDHELQLWTFQSNTGARRFYERHGFVAEEFTDGSNNEEQRLPDVRYRWRRTN